MSFVDGLRYRLQVWCRPDKHRAAIDAETEFHLSLDTMQLGDGTAARRRFGNRTAQRMLRREASGAGPADRLAQDARFAWRQLVREPALTLTVIVTLALGIAASTTMFAIIDQVLIRPPAGIADARRVVQVGKAPDGPQAAMRGYSVSYASYLQFREMRDLFSGVTAETQGRVTINPGPDAVRARVTFVAEDYFGTLGVRLALGRTFTTEETAPRSDARTVIVSWNWWRTRLGGAPNAVGRTINIRNARFTVIGVAPRHFTGTVLADNDLWLPLGARSFLSFANDRWIDDRGSSFFRVTMRLRPGVEAERATAIAAVRWSAWRVRSGKGGTKGSGLALNALAPGLGSAEPEHRVARLLAALSIALLLIACANVINLLLARSLARRREIAIRVALGISRGRLLRLFVADALLLALFAGAAALAFTAVVVPLARAVLFAGGSGGEWNVGWRLALFTAIVAVGAGVVVGTLPAIVALRDTSIAALQGSGRGAGQRGRRTRFTLLVVQGSLSVALLACCGLFVQSLSRINAKPVGFDLDHLLSVPMEQERTSDSTDASERMLAEAMRRRALATPGVEAAALSYGEPFEGAIGFKLTLPNGDSLDEEKHGTAFVYWVSPDYFATTGLVIRRGRPLSADDRGADVAVVDAGLAAALWPHADPIGQCFHVDAETSYPTCTRVVGVTDDARQRQLIVSRPQLQFYLPLTAAPRYLGDILVLTVRARNPIRIAATLHRALQDVRPGLPWIAVTPFTELVAPELRPWRLGARVFATFGGLALLIAMAGIFSVLRHTTLQRRRELGVRRALGAQSGSIARLVVREALAAALVASLLGSIAVVVSGRWLGVLLFEASPGDGAVLIAVNLILLTGCVVASAVPAWRATRADPMLALREE